MARSFGMLHSLSLGDETALSATITTLGLIYWLVAAAALVNVWSQWIETEDASLKGDKKKFWELAERRMPQPVKAALLLISLLLWMAFFFMPFGSVWAGTFTVFSITVALTFIWEIVVDLDNPLDGVWRVKNIPPRE